MIRKLLLSLCLLSSVAFTQGSHETSQYMVGLPDGWTQISRETADFLLTELNFPINPHSAQKYDYLYQHKLGDSLFTLPYILVQFNAGARIRSGELKNLGANTFQYDPETHYLWGFRDSTLEVIIPTEQGTINFFCYSSKAGFPTDKAQFVQIIRSVRVNPSIAYKKNILRDLGIISQYFYRDENIHFVLIVSIIALIVARFKTRKRQESTDGGNPAR
jgi:hypothetical protein